jgi:hypothetical protein
MSRYGGLLVIEDIISLKVNLLQSKLFFLCYLLILHTGFLVGLPGKDPGFQVRGGGALKKIAPSGGRRENVWCISCEKSRFYAKKNHIFSNCGGRREIFGVFRVKNHDFTPKNHIISNFRVRPLTPWSRPWILNL